MASSHEELERRKDKAIDELTTMFSKDILSMEEYERRVEIVQASVSIFEIDNSMKDLAVYKDSVSDSSSTDHRGSVHVSREIQNQYTILSERKLKGSWLKSRNLFSFTFMGSTKMDLKNCTIPEGVTEIEIFALMGEVKMRLPSTVHVENSLIPIMADSKVVGDSDTLPDGAPTVRIKGFALMAEVKVELD